MFLRKWFSYIFSQSSARDLEEFEIIESAPIESKIIIEETKIITQSIHDKEGEKEVSELCRNFSNLNLNNKVSNTENYNKKKKNMKKKKNIKHNVKL